MLAGKPAVKLPAQGYGATEPASPYQFIVAATKSSNAGSSKVLAVITAPAAIMSSWLRPVRIPMVAMPAEDAEKPKRGTAST